MVHISPESGVTILITGVGFAPPVDRTVVVVAFVPGIVTTLPAAGVPVSVTVLVADVDAGAGAALCLPNSHPIAKSTTAATATNAHLPAGVILFILYIYHSAAIMLPTLPKAHKTILVQVLKRGGVGVLPTDTIYGIVGSARNKNTVAKIYRLRKRNLKKPMIILIASVADLKKFGVRLQAPARKVLKKAWPGKVSVILPCPSKKFTYLHRGTYGLAFRMPRPAWLRALLKATGPLVAPSANVEGEPPARTIGEAKKYFTDKVDFYVDAGKMVSKPSTLIAISGDEVKVLRK